MSSTPDLVTDRPTVEGALVALFGPRARVARRHSVGGGCINETGRLELADGRTVFLKENSGRLPDMFRREAEGLLALCGAPGPRVPRPLAVHGDAERQFLLLEDVRSAPRRADFWEKFGRDLARMHGSQTDRCGFSADNYIGATVQPNPRERSWTAFYRRHRLGFQLGLARDHGRADRALVRGVEGVMARLDELLDTGSPEAWPSLLHGDLWSGNFMVGPDGHAVIIDPAVYYGHPEADLAMTELFGRFDDRFYAAYRELRPLAPGYERRRAVYNLYHALNHLNLFGGGYRSMVMGLLRLL